MRFITLTALCFFLLWGTILHSQSGDVSLLGSGGNAAASENIFLSYSFGEPINIFENNGNHWLTQGFQQPGKINITSTPDVKEDITIRITPNPAANELSLHLPPEEKCDRLFIMSLTGQRRVIESERKSEKIILYIGSLPAGMYWIEGECNQQRAFIKSFIKI